MNNFGLGLILNFTDNATSGIQRATGAFNDLNNATAAFSGAGSAEKAMSQIAYAAGILGNELYSVGGRVTRFFTGVVSDINNVGTAMLSARTQLSTLHGSDAAGNEMIEKIRDYAEKSIFAFEDMIPTVIMLKANGIEAFDSIATSSYKASNGIQGVSQTLMDYAADLAAFNPQMHNMYGTGIQAAMGALNEYIAEGNARSLKSGASLDITALLGEEKGKTIEERSRQVADLIEQLGMVGMTANLAGQPMQVLSNMGDKIFNFKSQISESGLYDAYSELVNVLAEYVFAIPDEEWAEMAQLIADSLSELLGLLKPILQYALRFVDMVREFVKMYPDVSKSVIKFTALAGVLGLVAGAVLKVLSVLGMLRLSLSMLGIGNKAFTLLGFLKNMGLYVLPLIAQIVLLKTVWDKNMFGIQERVQKTVEKIKAAFTLLADALPDNTLSMDNYNLAKRMGLLPFIEAILQVKYHWDFLVNGFKKGWDAFFKGLEDALVKIGFLDEKTGSFSGLLTKVLEKITAPGMTDNWEKLGYILGMVAGHLTIIFASLPIILKIAQAIGFIINLVSKLGVLLKAGRVLVQALSYIPKILGGCKTILGAILSAIGSVIIAILGFFGIAVTLPAWVVGLIAVAIVAAVVLIIKYWDQIKEFFINIGAAIAEFFEKLWPFLVEFLLGLWDKIVSIPVIGPILGVLWDLLVFIVDLLFKVIEIVWGAVKAVASIVWSLAKALFNIGKSIVNFIIAIVKFIGNIIYVIYEAVRVVVLGILWVLKGLASAIWEYCLEPIWNVISWVLDKIAAAIHVVVEVFVKAAAKIKEVLVVAFEVIAKICKPIIDGIGEALSAIIDGLTWVTDKLSKGVHWIGDKLSSAGDFIQEAVGLSTGGYVKTTGIAMLHPNEVVVNDNLTKGLSGFLDDYENRKKQSPLIKQNIVVSDDYEQKEASVFVVHDDDDSGDRDDRRTPSPVSQYVSNKTESTTTNNSVYNDSTSGSDTVNNDNRVVFESGSIVFNVDKDAKFTDAELEAMSEKLMKIFARKAQLRGIQTRK